MKTSAKYSVFGAALMLLAVPFAVSAKTMATPGLPGSLSLAVQAPAGADLNAATDQSVKVARRMIRRSFRAPQRGGWRTLRNRHGGFSSSRRFTNVHSRSGRFRSFRRIRNRHGSYRR